MSWRAQNYKCTDIGNKSFNLTENVIKMYFHELEVRYFSEFFTFHISLKFCR